MDTPEKDENIELPEEKGSEPENQENPLDADAGKTVDETPVTAEEPQPEVADLHENERARNLKNYIRNKTAIGLTVLILGLTAFTWAFSWVIHQPKGPDPEEGAYKPLRSGLTFNEKINRLFFSENHLAPQYPASAAVKEPKVN